MDFSSLPCIFAQDSAWRHMSSGFLLEERRPTGASLRVDGRYPGWEIPRDGRYPDGRRPTGASLRVERDGQRERCTGGERCTAREMHGARDARRERCTGGQWSLESAIRTLMGACRGVLAVGLRTALHSRRVVARPLSRRRMRPVTVTGCLCNGARATAFSSAILFAVSSGNRCPVTGSRHFFDILLL